MYIKPTVAGAVCGLAVLGLFAGAVVGQPAPSPVRVAWELNFEPTPPLRIEVDTGKGPQVYWYVLYTVTNNTGQDIDFNPESERLNEVEDGGSGDQAPAGPKGSPAITVDKALLAVHPKVFQAIKQRHAKTHPFLVSPVDAIGKLLQGKDNARTSVIVFPDLDPRVSKFTIYIAGLSGEVLTRPNPKYDPTKGSTTGAEKGDNKPRGAAENPKFFVLRKTLVLPYTLPGDVKTRGRAEPALGKMTWVMR